jgi:BirA family biotin operon repressor/biotin-[acetyl-CoA-carboxylase] ligase
VDRNALAAAICNRFEALWSAWIQTGSFAGVLERYRSRMAWLGMPVRLTLDSVPIEGILEGVDDDGLLLVETGGGTARIRSGEVTLRRNER